MVINIVNSYKLLSSNVWSVSFLLPHESINVTKEFSLITLAELVVERKESITLPNDETVVHYVGLENIEAKTGRLIDYSERHGRDIKSTCKVFRAGDILYGRLRPNLNKVLLNTSIECGECSTEIFVLIPNLDRIDPLYLSELLRSEGINKHIVSLIKGAALPRVSMYDLKRLMLPIPTIEKQHQLAKTIARKRDELEMHIQRAKQLPVEISNMLMEAYTGES